MVEKRDKPTVRQVYALAELCERMVVKGARSEARAPYCVHSLNS